MLREAAQALRLGRQRELRRAYQVAFTGPGGDAVLKDLLKFCGAGREVFVPGDPSATAYNTGRLRVATRLAAMLDMDERTFMKRAQEAQDDADN